MLAIVGLEHLDIESHPSEKDQDLSYHDYTKETGSPDFMHFYGIIRSSQASTESENIGLGSSVLHSNPQKG